MRVAFYGSSLLSSYWNGAATYYRGILRELARRGLDITFYEPDAFERQAHRDIAPPEWARVVVYEATPAALSTVLEQARHADVVVKASGVGVFDRELLEGILVRADPGAARIFWDVDAAATLDEVERDECHYIRQALPYLNAVLTYGGGAPVLNRYRDLGARLSAAIYNAVDVDTHFPVAPDPRFKADLSFLGNRLPDRERRVEGFFLDAALRLPERRFCLGGSGWETKSLPSNVTALGHIGTQSHNAFNCSATAVLNIARDSMATAGYSPATRVFEAAAAGACLISDAWEGMDMFLDPGREVIVARDGAEVASALAELTHDRARMVGEAARHRVLKDHTYRHRGDQLVAIFDELLRHRDRRSA